MYTARILVTKSSKPNWHLSNLLQPTESSSDIITLITADLLKLNSSKHALTLNKALPSAASMPTIKMVAPNDVYVT
jgi:hypothetical protein